MTDTLIEFPSQIAVKAMGLNENNFESLVSGLVLPFIEPAQARLTTLPSKEGKYLSVSVRFTAMNIEQLESVYAALRAEPLVLYTL